MKEPKRSEVGEASSKLSIREKVSFGFGDLSHGLAAASIGFWMLKYMTDVAGLGAYSAGLAIMIGRAWDSVTDPLMGWISDHTKSRWGKRRPYLLFGAIPYALAFAALWAVPEFGGHEVSIFAYAALSLVVFNTCLTVVFVPYTTLTAAITRNYDERTSLTGYRMAASQFGFLLGAAVPVFLVENLTSEKGKSLIEPLGRDVLFGSWAGTPREAYLIMGCLFAFLMIISIWAPFFGTREKNFQAKESKPATAFSYASSILEELGGNKPFRVAVYMLLITNCATTLVAVNLAFYLEYVLHLEKISWLFFSLFMASIASMPAWVYLSKRFGKVETYRGAMLCYVLVLLSLLFLPSKAEGMIFTVAILAGVFNAAGLMIPWAIVPDVVEYDELRTGKRREGLFYGGTTFCYKMATALAVFVSGLVLEKVINYQPNQVQTESVQQGIRFLIGILPSALLIGSALLSYKYPLSKERHKAILEELKTK